MFLTLLFLSCRSLFIFLTGINRLPGCQYNLTHTSVFESDRVKLILFNKHFSEEDGNTFLKEKFRKEYSENLNQSFVVMIVSLRKGGV